MSPHASRYHAPPLEHSSSGKAAAVQRHEGYTLDQPLEAPKNTAANVAGVKTKDLHFLLPFLLIFVVPFFFGGGEGPSLFFSHPWSKKKVSKKTKKPFFPTHPSERKPRCSTRCPASKKATSTSRFSTSEASKSAWPSRFPMAIG